MERDGLNWKSHVALLRRAQESNVVLVETDDVERFRELLVFLSGEKGSRAFSVDFQRVLVVDPWEGLLEFRGFDGGVARFDRVSGEGFFDFAGVLREAEGALKEQSTALIIKNVVNRELADAVLIPLLSWCNSDEVRAAKSTVFVFTSDLSLISEGLRKMCICVSPPLSEEWERREILERIVEEIRGSPLSRVKDVSVEFDDGFVRDGRGLTLHEFETAVLRSVFERRRIDRHVLVRVKQEAFEKRGFRLAYPKEGFGHIGGYWALKRFLQDFILKVLRSSVAAEWGLEPIRGIILFGIGGTGKTLLARAMANELGMPFIKVDSSQIFGSLVGESERNVRRLVEVAEAAAPCIVFIDEIDQLGLSRESYVSTDSGTSRRVQNMLMDWLGNPDRRAIVVGATNLIRQMDRAFIRAGRFDALIPVFPPNRDARREIFRVHLEVHRRIPYTADLDGLADATDKWTGAEIEVLVKTAAYLALDDGRVGQRHFDAAMEELQVGLERREQEIQQFLKDARDYCSYRRLLREQLEEYRGKSKVDAMLENL